MISKKCKDLFNLYFLRMKGISNQKLFTNIEWRDAQQMAKDHPDSFHAPSQNELDSIEIGYSVKICDGEERFWIIVKEIKEDNLTIIGEINNNLIGDQSYILGDLVQFTKNNIYNVNSPDYKERLRNAGRRLIEISRYTNQQCLQLIIEMVNMHKSIEEIEDMVNEYI